MNRPLVFGLLLTSGILASAVMLIGTVIFVRLAGMAFA